jgi:hypothetical protein
MQGLSLNKQAHCATREVSARKDRFLSVDRRCLTRMVRNHCTVLLNNQRNLSRPLFALLGQMELCLRRIGETLVDRHFKPECTTTHVSNSLWDGTREGVVPFL